MVKIRKKSKEIEDVAPQKGSSSTCGCLYVQYLGSARFKDDTFSIPLALAILPDTRLVLLRLVLDRGKRRSKLLWKKQEREGGELQPCRKQA